MDERPFPRWPGVVGSIACVAGLGVAVYLTYEHYSGSASLACSDKGIVNCLEVTTSTYSKFLGIPVADLGLVFFAVMLPLQLPYMWRRSEPIIRNVRLAWATVGLVIGPLPALHRAVPDRRHRLWCTAVHVLTFIVFATTVYATFALMPFDEDDLVHG